MQPDADGKVAMSITLSVLDQELSIDMRLPARPTRPGELLPLYRGLAEHMVQASLVKIAEEGRTVSCSKGCGACCRQVVPLSELEARSIVEVLDGLPEPRRTAVRERFAAARRRLAECGLLDYLEDTSRLPREEVTGFGMRYFAAGVPCPFLEDEACSIYEERPIICRQYLVTSPPEHCAHPTRENIAPVPVPGSVAAAVRWLDAEPGADRSPWVPLVLAPEWVLAHPEPPPRRTGPELAQELFTRLASGELPDLPADGA